MAKDSITCKYLPDEVIAITGHWYRHEAALVDEQGVELTPRLPVASTYLPHTKSFRVDCGWLYVHHGPPRAFSAHALKIFEGHTGVPLVEIPVQYSRPIVLHNGDSISVAVPTSL